MAMDMVKVEDKVKAEVKVMAKVMDMVMGKAMVMDMQRWGNNVAVTGGNGRGYASRAYEEGDACGAGFLARQLVESNDAVISALQP
eukprot:gene8789-biopygen18156